MPSPVHKLFLPLFLILSGCGHLGGMEPGENAPESAAADPTSACDHQWLLDKLSIDGREHRSGLLWKKLWRDRPYFTCDKLGYVRGSAGNNPYLGRFALSDSGRYSWLQAPGISRMSDVRDSGELEQDFLKALPRTDNLVIHGDSLILRGDGGATRLEFRRAQSNLE